MAYYICACGAFNDQLISACNNYPIREPTNALNDDIPTQTDGSCACTIVELYIFKSCICSTIDGLSAGALKANPSVIVGIGKDTISSVVGPISFYDNITVKVNLPY